MRKTGIALVALLVIFGGGWWYFAYSNEEITDVIEKTEMPMQTPAEKSTSVRDEQGAAIGDENLANFKCEGGKTITAVFERDIVGVTLSDGRQLVLRQAPSGSGIRYLSNDTKIEFRGKGNEGSLIESGITTYKACSTVN